MRVKDKLKVYSFEIPLNYTSIKAALSRVAFMLFAVIALKADVYFVVFDMAIT